MDGADGARALLRRARENLDQGHWSAALELAIEAVAIDPTLPGAAEVIGEARRRSSATRRTPGLKQLTVLFVDVTNSTGITSRLGAERTRRLFVEVFSVAVDAVHRFDGRIAKYLGDGFLAYFGHPRSHEDDARRAVLAGLAMIERVEAARPGWQDEYGELVEVSVGMDTGMVIVGPVGDIPGSPDDVFGDAANVASRIQGQAAPMTVLVSGSTHELVEGWFDFEPLGPATLRNFPTPVELFRTLAPTSAESRSEARQAAPQLVGRWSERRQLLDEWRQVDEGGSRRVVAITGDGGIGKSRLLEHLTAAVLADGVPVMTLLCSEVHRATAWHPIVVALNRYFVGPRRDETLTIDVIGDRLRSLDAGGVDVGHLVSIFARLLDVDGGSDLPPDEFRAAAFDALAWLVERLSSDAPLLLTIDDIDHADPTTLALVQHLVATVPTPMLVATTGRSSSTVLSADAVVALGGIDRDAALEMVRSLAPDISDADADAIVRRSDGMPLHLEELARMAADGHVGDALSLQLHASISARLDEQLDERSRALLDRIVVLGDETPQSLLAALDDAPDEVERSVGVLERNRLVVVRSSGVGPTVRVRQPLTQQVVYEALADERRQSLHRAAAAAIVADPSFGVGAELLARHHAGAGNHVEAAAASVEAGRRAAASGGYAEALARFEAGLASCERIEPGPMRDGLELALRFGVGAMVSTTQGYTHPDARAAYERASDLGELVGPVPQAFPALWGTWTYWYVLGEIGAAEELAQQCRVLAADNPGDDVLRWEVGAVLGYQRFATGDFDIACDELRLATNHLGYEHLADYPQDTAIVCSSALAMAEWFRGDRHESRVAARTALAHATGSVDERRGLFSTSWVHCNLAFRAQLDDRPDVALDHAQQAVAIAGARGYQQWLAAGMIHQAIAQCSLGQADEGYPMLEAMVDLWRSVGRDADGSQVHPVLMTPYFAGRLAEIRYDRVDIDGAAALTDELLSATETSGERFWDAELLCLKAKIQHDRGEPSDARASVSAAIELATKQGAVPLRERAERLADELGGGER